MSAAADRKSAELRARAVRARAQAALDSALTPLEEIFFGRHADRDAMVEDWRAMCEALHADPRKIALEAIATYANCVNAAARGAGTVIVLLDTIHEKLNGNWEN